MLDLMVEDSAFMLKIWKSYDYWGMINTTTLFARITGTVMITGGSSALATAPVFFTALSTIVGISSCINKHKI